MVSEPRQPGKAEILLALVSTGVMTWFMLPPQERYWLKLSVLRQLHGLSSRVARNEGRQGMGEELKGRDPWPRYGAAYQASRLRDVLAKTLEDMRP